MRKGFFAAGQFEGTRVPLTLVPKCGVCGLHTKCQSGKMPVAGKGERKILVVGEAPGQVEDERGRPFVGKAGQFLRQRLARLKVDLDRDCWTTNAARCRPWSWERSDGRTYQQNRTPTDKEVDFCRPYLLQAIRELNPEVILLLGGEAVKSLIGWLWKPDTGGVMKWAGFRIPSRRLNAWVCVAFHPSYVMRSDYGESDKMNPVRVLKFDEQLAGAFALSGRPYDQVPDAGKQLELVHDPDRAAKRIRALTNSCRERGRPAAFDYETNMLKPDAARARIVSCAISDGAVSVAYPWAGEAITATREFIQSDVPKLGQNAKFEERWSLKEFGHGVESWEFDGMLGAHALDNRDGICSVKFQAFVTLGVDLWSKAVERYLQADGGNTENRIAEVSPDKLLKYNSYDSLYEWQVGRDQMRRLNLWRWDDGDEC